jgi:hypothetical protein
MNRNYTLGIGGTALPLPCFFSSISCIKTNLPPLEYLRIITALKHSQFLISAYDVYHAFSEQRTEIDSLLKQSLGNGQIILLDSGNYESYWKKDGTWTVQRYSEICTSIPFHVAFCFDNQNPPNGIDALVKEAVDSVVRDQQSLLSSGTVVPIVHGPRELLPESIGKVAEQLRPLLVAVPERSLGDGVLQRADTVHKIRSSLNGGLDYYCPLHLLGTGNPYSILIYSACGADSFDGLEWCQTSVDHDSGRLFHFQQWDFFSEQTGLGDLHDLPYSQKVLAHNLIFYSRWLEKVGSVLKEGKTESALRSYLPDRVVGQLRAYII